jgi:hypothetical protein
VVESSEPEPDPEPDPESDAVVVNSVLRQADVAVSVIGPTSRHGMVVAVPS